jgi:hypothetical protein
MKVKKITVEFDNGATVDFEGEELEALQKIRGILEFIDTGTNILKLAGLKPIGTPISNFRFSWQRE